MFSILELLGRRTPQLKVVDVGAFWFGEDDLPYGKLLKAGNTEVVGFEPQEEECNKLVAMNRKGHTYLPYAIGDGSLRRLYINSSPMTSSLYEPNTPLISLFQTLGELMAPVGSIEVRTHRLDDLRECDRTDYLKLDVQGAELDCLKGGERLLEDCLVVAAEVNFIPIYKGMPLFADVDAFLRSRGFMLHQLLPAQCRCVKPITVGGDLTRGLNQAIWSDAVYVKDITRLGELEADQLLKLAVILHETLGSYDLAAHCLRYFDARLDLDRGAAAPAGTRLHELYCTRLLGAPLNLPPIDLAEIKPKRKETASATA